MAVCGCVDVDVDVESKAFKRLGELETKLCQSF